MKINEKHLSAYLLGNAPTDKQGYLLKRGEGNRAFQRRWFVLKGNLLFYSEKESDREPIGVVILEDCSVEVSDSEDAYAFELGFDMSGARTYVLAASTQEEMEEWMQALTFASYDYMKRMVMDLQSQLDALTVRPERLPALRSHARSDQRSATTRSGMLVDFESFPAFDPSTAQLPGNLLVQSDSSQRGSARSFEEMHEEFGRRIREITGQESKLVSP